MSQSVIEVNRLGMVFGERAALDDVSFSVAAGTFVGLLGPNGAGKTTTINCLTTLLLPDAGWARVAGHDVRTDPAAVRSCIAVTGQFATLDMMLTGRDDFVLFGRLLGLGTRAARARTDELLAQFDIAEPAGQSVRTYSGGQCRRLDLAVSLVVPRPVLFLDEPTTGLDPRSRLTLWKVVRELRAAGTTILLTTQNLEEADKLTDRIIVIDQGHLIAGGTADELKDKVGGSVCAIRVGDAEARERAVGALKIALPGVAVVDGSIALPARTTGVLAEVIRSLDSVGVTPDDLAMRHPTLEDVLFALTGKPIKPQPPSMPFAFPIGPPTGARR